MYNKIARVKTNISVINFFLYFMFNFYMQRSKSLVKLKD